MDILLYQFESSHYCEKARWALDYKNVQYKTKNLLPGLHRIKLRGKVKDTSLPVLLMNGNYIQGSDRIIDFLDQASPINILTPTHPEQRAEAADWESFASTELATPLSVFHYSNLLETPDLLKQRYISNGPWYAPLYYAITFKRICEAISELYKITKNSAEQAHATIEAGLRKLEQHLHARNYLVGNQFSRADLSIAALLSPLAAPPQLEASSNAYPAIMEFRNQLTNTPVMKWVNHIYQTHRY